MAIHGRIVDRQLGIEGELENVLGEHHVIVPETERILHAFEEAEDGVGQVVGVGLGQLEGIPQGFAGDSQLVRVGGRLR
jgi:hypothetical protein